jgi:hypothetical protein
MLPFSFESENRTVRGILSRGGRELLTKDKEGEKIIKRRGYKARDGVHMERAVHTGKWVRLAFLHFGRVAASRRRDAAP